MTLAAIIPYYHPRGPGSGRVCSCVVVIADGPHVLASEEIEVGRVKCLDHRRYPCAECAERQGKGRERLFMRVVGPAEVAAVVARAVEMLEEHRVPEARVELPSGSGVEDERGKAIVTALHESGTPTFLRLVPASKGDLAARLAVLLKDEGPDAVGRATEPLPPAVGPLGRAPLGSGCGATGLRVSPDDDPAPPAAQAPKAARRILGVDSGARWIRLSIIEGEVAPVRYVASLALEVGHVVPLRAPKIVTRSNGTTYEKTSRRVIDDADVARAQREAGAFAQAHAVDEAVVESATFVYEGAGALLMRAQRIGGVIEGALRAAGLPVATRSSREWRATAKRMAEERTGSDGETAKARAVQRAGTQAAGAADRLGEDGASEGCGSRDDPRRPEDVGGDQAAARAGGWRPAVRALVSGLPATLDEHGLDATGAALSAVAPKVAPKPARVRAPGGKGYDVEGQRARREAKRRALGCPCVKPHEDPACPIRVAKLAKVSQKMKGNQNAKRGA